MLEAEIDHYKVIKFVCSLIFGKIVGNYYGQEWLTDVNLFKYLNIVVKSYTSHNFLSDEVKEKLYKLMSASRQVKTDNYEERVDIINEIISNLNSQKEDNSDFFYREELCKRTGTKKFMQPKYDITNAVKDIEESMAYDYLVLATHNEELIDMEGFIVNHLADLSTAPNFYFSSINAILDECPEIFKNDEFRSRVYMVLNLIGEQYNTHKTKKAIKLFKKQIGNRTF